MSPVKNGGITECLAICINRKLKSADVIDVLSGRSSFIFETNFGEYIKMQRLVLLMTLIIFSNTAVMATCPTTITSLAGNFVFESNKLTILFQPNNVSQGFMGQIGDVNSSVGVAILSSTTLSKKVANTSSTYNTAVYSGSLLSSLGYDAWITGSVDFNSGPELLKTGPTSPVVFYYSYNSPIYAKKWVMNSGAVTASSDGYYYPASCMIYTWNSDPTNIMPAPPPATIFVVGNSGNELLSTAIGNSFNNCTVNSSTTITAAPTHCYGVVRVRAIRQ